MTNGFFNDTTFFNVSFAGQNVEHIILNGDRVWSRPNLFFAAAAVDVPTARLKPNDLVVEDGGRIGQNARVTHVDYESDFSPATSADGYYLILGE